MTPGGKKKKRKEIHKRQGSLVRPVQLHPNSKKAVPSQPAPWEPSCTPTLCDVQLIVLFKFTIFLLSQLAGFLKNLHLMNEQMS